ncbi:MAG: hypothetical protein ACOX16_03925 [Candidatus Izemoplasmatales bacterium]|jgi:hypothetical protein
MLKKRVTLSWIALISSVFLFVFATFAWFAVSGLIDVLGPTIEVINLEVTATLEVSDDGIEYSEAEGIALENAVPGTIKYYRLTIENVGGTEVYVKVSLHGFEDVPNNSEIDYDNEVNLLEKVVLNAANDVNEEEIEDEYLIDLLPEIEPEYFTTSHLYLVGNMYLDTEEVGILNFSLQVSDTANNQYQNHALEISGIMISGVNP